MNTCCSGYWRQSLNVNFKCEKFIWQLAIVWKFFFQVIQYQLNIQDKVEFMLRWYIVEHTCNRKTDLWLLSNRFSLNVVMQSWNCWPMCKYCPMFICCFKQKGKKVQDSVHITQTRSKFCSTHQVIPLIPSQSISWLSSFSSWWDNKVLYPFWNPFLHQTFLETSHTANCIVRFLIKRCCWLWWPYSKSSFFEKMFELLIERRKSSGYQFLACQVGVTIITEGTFSSSTFLRTLWIKANGRNIDSYDHFCCRIWLYVVEPVLESVGNWLPRVITWKLIWQPWSK